MAPILHLRIAARVGPRQFSIPDQGMSPEFGVGAVVEVPAKSTGDVRGIGGDAPAVASAVPFVPPEFVEGALPGVFE
jgi:hypothetical protein